MDMTRVLIVDDEPGMLRTTAMILERKGFEVKTAHDGPDAIRIVGQRPFDVVLMDIKMPGMSGVEAFRRIKASRPEIAVIMMTGYSVEDLIADALGEGAVAVLHKPLDIPTTVKLIQTAAQAPSGCMILVADEDEDVTSGLVPALEAWGYTVAVATDSDGALAIAQDRSPDIMLVDLRLRPMNGEQLYAAVRQASPRVVVVVMAYSCDTSSELMAGALRDRAYVCVTKPLDLGRLGRVLEHIRNPPPVCSAMPEPSAEE